jgi:uncharacterized membrane protein
MPGMIWGLIWSWKNYHVKADFRVSLKIVAASILSALAAYLLISLVTIPWWIMLISGAVVFVLVYLTLIPLLGAVNHMDILNFQTMFSGLGAVSRVLNLPLKYMRRICRGNPD